MKKIPGFGGFSENISPIPPKCPPGRRVVTNGFVRLPPNKALPLQSFGMAGSRLRFMPVVAIGNPPVLLFEKGKIHRTEFLHCPWRHVSVPEKTVEVNGNSWDVNGM